MDRKALNRAEMVRAMEIIARAINDEEVFMGWLMCGVADGDIDIQGTDLSEIVEMGYTDTDTIIGLMDCFLRCMQRAYRSGGLYCDNEAVSTIGD